MTSSQELKIPIGPFDDVNQYGYGDDDYDNNINLLSDEDGDGSKHCTIRFEKGFYC